MLRRALQARLLRDAQAALDRGTSFFKTRKYVEKNDQKSSHNIATFRGARRRAKQRGKANAKPVRNAVQTPTR